MTSYERLIELHSKVMEASGPDREIDCRLHWLINGESNWLTAIPHNDSGTWEEQGSDLNAKPYTASIDADLALVERVLPGRSVAMSTGDGVRPHAVIQATWTEQAATLPLAIIASLLTALIVQAQP